MVSTKEYKAKTFVKMFSHLVSVSLTLMFFNHGHFLDAPETHSSLYCVSPEIGKWRIRQMLFASVLAITELDSTVLLRRFDLTLFFAIECETTVIDFFHHHNHTSLWSIWLSCVITDLHKEQISTSSWFKQNKPQNGLQQRKKKKNIFYWVVMSFTEQRRNFKREWVHQNVKARNKSDTFHKEDVKKYIYFFFFNKWSVKWGISENVDHQPQEFKLNILWVV